MSDPSSEEALSILGRPGWDLMLCLDAAGVLRGGLWAVLTFYSCVGTFREEDGLARAWEHSYIRSADKAPASASGGPAGRAGSQGRRAVGKELLGEPV